MAQGPRSTDQKHRSANIWKVTPSKPRRLVPPKARAARRGLLNGAEDNSRGEHFWCGATDCDIARVGASNRRNGKPQ